MKSLICIFLLLLSISTLFAAPAPQIGTNGLITVVNVKQRDYGAVGDGVTDDTAAIQAALNVARSSRSMLYIPFGTYRITDTLRVSGVIVEGANGGPQFSASVGVTTELRMDDGITNDVFAPPDQSANYTNVTIRNLKITGGNLTHAGVNMTRLSYSTIENCTIWNCDYGVIMDAKVTQQSYFNRVIGNKIGYNRIANLIYRDGANANVSAHNFFGGSTYGIIQTNAASGNSSESDWFQGVAAPNGTTNHVRLESGEFRLMTPYMEVSTGSVITNSIGARLVLIGPTFGGGSPAYVSTGTRFGTYLYAVPVPGSVGFRGLLGGLWLTNDWSGSANNYVITLDPRIRDDLPASTNLNYLINYGSEVVSGASSWIFYGNNVGGTQNTNAVVVVNLKGDGGINMATFADIEWPEWRLHRGEGGGEASIQQNIGTGANPTNVYAFRASRTNAIANNLIIHTNAVVTNTLSAGTVTVTDDAYGAGWDGSTNVPTKNALYDKIESLGGDSQTPWLSDIDGGGNSLTNVFELHVETLYVDLMVLDAPLGVASGGTGLPTVDADNLISGNGTNAMDKVTVGTGLNLEGSAGSTRNLIASNVVENALLLSDNTTNNATASRHGFLTKLSGNASEVLLGNGLFGAVPGGGTDAAAIHDNVAGEIAAITEKVTPVSADLVLIEDSEDSNNKKKVQIGNLPGGGGIDTADIQIYTTPGTHTWTNPAGGKFTFVTLISGGGGGGSGRKGAAGTARVGGGGGGGGGFADMQFSTAILGATETVTVGGGGIGGASVTADSTSGANGANGTNSTFGAWLKASAGTGGAGGGEGAGGTAGTAGQSEYGGGNGNIASLTGGSGSNGANAGTFGAGGGGGGGGITSADSPSAGGNGGTAGSSVLPTQLLGGTGGSASNNGGTPGAAAANQTQGGGGGAGGGGRITAGEAGDGSAGGQYGAGGGGGGAALNATSNSGDGGNGGNGIVIVVTVF